MAEMKQCPECECADVPINAKICPFCGHPFEMWQKDSPAEVQSSPKTDIGTGHDEHQYYGDGSYIKNPADDYSRLWTLEQFAFYLEVSGWDVAFKKAFIKQLKKVTIQEMNAAHAFGEQVDVRSRAEKVAFLIAQSSPEDSRQYLLLVDYLLWRGFDISHFNIQDAQRYRRCSLDDLARSGFNGKECQNARTVKDLLRIATDFNPTAERIYQIFFTDNIFDDMNIKKILQNLLRQEKMKECMYRSRDEMELSILCHYNLENNRMETAKWIRKILNAGHGRLLTPEILPKWVNGSPILSDKRLKSYIVKSLEAELKNKAWRIGEKDDKEVKRTMKLLRACLRDEVAEKKR